MGLCSPSKCHFSRSSVVANAVNLGAFSTVKPNSFATVKKLSLITFTHYNCLLYCKVFGNIAPFGAAIFSLRESDISAYAEVILYSPLTPAGISLAKQISRTESAYHSPKGEYNSKKLIAFAMSFLLSLHY